MRGRPVTGDEAQEWAGLYETGLSSNDIGNQVGRDGRLIRTHLSALGVLEDRKTGVRRAVLAGKIRKPGPRVDDHIFDELTPATAWVLGLIFGDGHVTNGSIDGTYRVNLCGRRKVLEKVAVVIGHPTGPVQHSQSKKLWILEWTSFALVEALGKNYGLTGGSKARTLRMPQIPDALLPHFVRGLWDSDGHWRVRGNYVAAELWSASPMFIHDVKNMLLVHRIGSDGFRIRGCKRKLNGKVFYGFSLNLSAASTRKLKAWLYTGSNAPERCTRKYNHACGRKKGG